MVDKQRKLVTSGYLWARFKKYCKRHEIGLNDALNAAIRGMVDGQIRIHWVTLKQPRPHFPTGPAGEHLGSISGRQEIRTLNSLKFESDLTVDVR